MVNYMTSKEIMQEGPDFDPKRGVNQMVLISDNNYLKDLQTQQKRMCYPTMFETTTDF